MDLAKLKLFAEVAEHGSLTKASIALSSVPSALSRKIAALERECGGRLFHRTGRGVTLTELGQRILPRIKELLGGLDVLSQEIRANAGVPSGQVRIGLLASLMHPLIDRLFRDLRERHPGIRLNIFGGSNGQLDEWLASGFVDMAVLFRYGKSEVGNEQPLGIVDTYLVGPKNDPLTRQPTVKFSVLDKLPLILPGAPNGLRVILDQLARKRGIELNILMEVNSLPVQRDLVAEGGIYTVLAGYAAERDVRAGLLQTSRIVNPSIERIVTLGLTSQRPASLASREVARLIVATLEEMADSMELRRMPKRNHKRNPAPGGARRNNIKGTATRPAAATGGEKRKTR
jgi:LysR family nitrogen assimilation transcriptional regulator